MIEIPINKFHKEYLIPDIEKLSFILPHVQILGNINNKLGYFSRQNMVI